MLIRTFRCKVEHHDGSKSTFLDTSKSYDEIIKKVRNYSNVKSIIKIQAITNFYEFNE